SCNGRAATVTVIYRPSAYHQARTARGRQAPRQLGGGDRSAPGSVRHRTGEEGRRHVHRDVRALPPRRGGPLAGPGHRPSPGGRVSDLVIRPLAVDETDLFLTYPDPLPVDVLPRTLSYPDLLARGECRPQWTWVALRGGRTCVARAAWWADPGGSHPDCLHWFDPGAGPDRIEVGAALLTAAHRTMRTAGGGLPDYHLFLPPAWRELPVARAAGEDRIAAAGKAGLRLFVERLNYRWTRDCPLPARSTRLEFRPAGDAEVLDVLRRVLVGT